MFGHELRRLRQRAGVSQYRLASWSGVDQSYVARLEQGNRLPSVAVLVALGHGLNLSRTEFLQLVYVALVDAGWNWEALS